MPENIKKISKIRSLSKREKILLAILSFLVLEVFLYAFLIRDKNISYNNLKNLPDRKEKIDLPEKFTGLADFGEENLNKFKKNLAISDEEIQITDSYNKKVLEVQKIFQEGDLANLKLYSAYYGFSEINLHREKTGDFLGKFIGQKEVENLSYGDIRKAYFEDGKNLEKDSQNINKNSEVTEISNAGGLPKANNNLKAASEKIAEVPKNEIKEDDLLNEKLEENKDLLEIPKDFNLKSFSYDPNKIEFENLEISGLNSKGTYLENIKALSIFYGSEDPENIEDSQDKIIKILFPEGQRDISFEILLDQNFKGSFGIIGPDGSLSPYKEDENSYLSNFKNTGQRDWEYINFKGEDIRGIFIDPHEDRENIIFLRKLRHES
ncbi:hypothetical protein [uncultured Peptoniphilus sp.]|uniref:hypothetical protein n=1 Tax=uncultured Peptoniphilus sp. TaxID=254354 RepID=UPI002803EC44|nr:hypothetical protein [uncultured Peptoniphilus sp.]